ncbi:MAG TPA: LuxR C-terminal-related transcriptional regulator [Flavisolibacter sp.]|jgi:two-component system invasion response regulator UvrY|nr:LuxR C-terminal-related transcriptional regulator [Flavisolibacter sp.]
MIAVIPLLPQAVDAIKKYGKGNQRTSQIFPTYSIPKEQMKEALIEVSEGKKYICREIRETLAGNFISDENKVNFNTLSVREIEIIDLVRQGSSSKEIAIEKSISVKTVGVHRYNILKKLNLGNAAELVNYFNKIDI